MGLMMGRVRNPSALSAASVSKSTAQHLRPLGVRCAPDNNPRRCYPARCRRTRYDFYHLTARYLSWWLLIIFFTARSSGLYIRLRSGPGLRRRGQPDR